MSSRKNKPWALYRPHRQKRSAAQQYAHLLQLAQAELNERKLVEETLRRNELLFRVIFENANDGFQLTNANDEFILVNQRLCDMLGYSREELLKMHISDVQAPEQRGELGSVIKNELAEHGYNSFEVVDIHKNGQRIPAEISLARLDGSDQDLFISIVRDISERKKVEEQLHLQSSALNAAANAIVITDHNGSIEWVNQAFCLLTGYRQEEVLGKNPRDLIKSGVHDQAFFKNLWDTILSGQVWHSEIINRRKDGSHFIEEQTITPVKNSDNSIGHFIAVKQNISVRKEVEKAFLESEERYRSLFNRILDGYYRSTHAGKFVEINSAMARMFGYSSQEEMLAIDIKKELYFAPDERGTHLPDSGKGEIDIYRLRRKDGSEIWVEDRGTYIHDEQGNILFHEGMMRDVTQRVRTEESLAASEAKLRTLVEQVPAIVYTESALTRETLYISPQVEKLTGYTPNEWVQNPDLWKIMIHPDDLEAVTTEDARSNLTGTPFEIEYRIFTRDGREIWLHDESTLIENQGGTPLFWHGVMYDITERKKTEEELRRGEESYSGLFNTVTEAIYIQNSEGVFLNINAGVENMYGYTREEMIGKTPEFVSAPGKNDLANIFQIVQQVFATGKSEAFEFWGQRKNGEIFPKDCISNKGKYFGMDVIITTARDVTERKNVEESLRNSQERYRELFNSMLDGFALHEIICDKKGKPCDYRFIEVNPAYERLTGRLAADLLGKTMLEVMPNTEHHRIEMFGRVALTGEPVSYEDYSREIGKYLEVSVYCPRPGQFASIVVDITKRKLADETISLRVMELETLNRISLELRAVSRQEEVLSIVLDEALSILNTTHGSIELYNKTTHNLDKIIMRGWTANVIEPPVSSSEGISGEVFTTGRVHLSKEFASDPFIMPISRQQIPTGWGGACLPIRTTRQTLGVMTVSVQSDRELNTDELRLLSILSEMTGSALQRMQLHEETARRAGEFAALFETSSAISAENELNAVLKVIVDHAKELLNAASSAIYLYHAQNDELVLTVDTATYLTIGTVLKIGEGVAGNVALTRQPLRIDDYCTWEGRSPQYEGNSIHAVLEVPMLYGGVLIGVLTADEIGDSTRKFSEADERLLTLFASQAAGAIQSTRLHEETVHRLKNLQALREIDQAIANSHDLGLTLNILLTHTISQLGMDAADVLLLRPESNLLSLAASQGFNSLFFEDIHINDSFAGRAIAENRSIMSLTLESANENSKFGKLWEKEKFTCYWCVPLRVKDEVKGVLEIYRRTKFTPDKEWLEFLEALAGQAAIAIDRTQLFENLQLANIELNQAYDATIEGWSRALDLRDHETEGHTLRVTELTLKLARDMHVSESDLTAIRRGALLHDIGKMGVPDSILLKEGPLTGDEWVIMRTHPQLALEMLSPIDYLREALNIPYCHHEKWDGSGYPQGLKGENIPLAARIFAIVDVWDALTTDRPYRKKWTQQKTIEHILEQNGKHFDPQVVKVFLKSLE